MAFMSTIMLFFSGVMCVAHLLAKDFRVSVAGSYFRVLKVTGSTMLSSAIATVILMVPQSTPLILKASVMVRTLLKLFKTFIKYIKQKQRTQEMSTNHGLRSAETAQTGHFSFDKSMKHILGI